MYVDMYLLLTDQTDQRNNFVRRIEFKFESKIQKVSLPIKSYNFQEQRRNSLKISGFPQQ